VERVELEGDLTVRRAAELKSTLLGPLEKGGGVEVDLSRVTSLDCAGVQLLLLARRTADARKVELQFVRHSSAAIETLELCGLSAALDAPLASHSGRAGVAT
jgi:anti-anti-sigma factor